jgi:4'-phosphopantetheinyl transferase
MKEDFVDILYGDILLDESHQQKYWPFLSKDEQKKAKTFKRQDLQKKYIYTRAVLRKFLASYINIQPEDLDIKTNQYGKPFLAKGGLYFNLSHTGNKLVIAISNIDNIGIDLEQCRHRKNLPGLVNKCFSKEESAFWHSLPEEKKINIFFQFWVKKEAFVKAVGRGISMGLNQCIINPENQTQFLSIPNNYGSSADWKIIDLPLDKNCACALVIKNQAIQLKRHTLTVSQQDCM